MVRIVRETVTEADVKGLLLPSVVESKFINPHLKQEAERKLLPSLVKHSLFN